MGRVLAVLMLLAASAMSQGNFEEKFSAPPERVLNAVYAVARDGWDMVLFDCPAGEVHFRDAGSRFKSHYDVIARVRKQENGALLVLRIDTPKGDSGAASKMAQKVFASVQKHLKDELPEEITRCETREPTRVGEVLVRGNSEDRVFQAAQAAARSIGEVSQVKEQDRIFAFWTGKQGPHGFGATSYEVTMVDEGGGAVRVFLRSITGTRVHAQDSEAFTRALLQQLKPSGK